MTASTLPSNNDRLHDLDAVRAFALILGVLFHAALSFLPVPVGWAVMDVSTSPLVWGAVVVSHSFRMTLFFLIAGFFSRMACHRKGNVAFIKSRAFRIGLPFVIGWVVFWPLLSSGWAMGAAAMRGDYSVTIGFQAALHAFDHLPFGPFAGTHLWFLYYLGLVTVAALSLRWCIHMSGRPGSWLMNQADKTLNWLTAKRVTLVVLAAISARILWAMSGWGVDTPDKSLLPHWPIFLLYGGSFLTGWLLHRNAIAFRALARLSPENVTIALVASAVTLFLWLMAADWVG